MVVAFTLVTEQVPVVVVVSGCVAVTEQVRPLVANNVPVSTSGDDTDGVEPPAAMDVGAMVVIVG